MPLSSGLALVVYILSRFSLFAGMVLAAAAGAAAACVVWNRTPASGRSMIKRRALVGLVGGALATLAYDLCRYLVVTSLSFTFWPFDTLTIFGGLIIGNGGSARMKLAVGILYHCANGVGFGVAFMLLFRSPGPLSGLAWAAVLELFMISLYPTWLDLKALDELLSVSILGHVAYGLVLGGVAHGMLRAARPPDSLSQLKPGGRESAYARDNRNSTS